MLEQDDQEHNRRENDEIPDNDREKDITERLFFMEPVFIDWEGDQDPERQEKQERLVKFIATCWLIFHRLFISGCQITEKVNK